MAKLGTVVDSILTTNRDSEEKVYMLQCEMSEEGDIQNVELYRLAGEENRPPDDSTVIIVSIGDAWKVAIAGEDGVEPAEKEKGERLLYSTDNGGPRKATIWLKKDGSIELNGNADFAVAYEDLKAAFDQLKSDFNDLVAVYNGHNHPTAPSGPVSPPSATGTNSSADMSAAKIESIKVP